jgi:oxygen-independent coproporphyrinogen-3 oxidase
MGFYMSTDKTKVGNFFVSNYPQYSFWLPENVGDAKEALDRAPEEGADMGVYIHIPFCRKRCHFCYFRVYTDKNAEEIKNYLSSSIEEFRKYASKNFVGGRLPSFIYFGGGTPSYLSRDQFRYLSDEMKKIMPWTEAQEVTVECEPGTLTEQKLQNFKDIGVTRLSLGIENFKDEILEQNNRAHKSEEVYKAYDFARKIGFDQINIDLISGMMGETDENWRDVIEKSIAMDADSITVYQMEIPFNTSIYKDMKENNEEVAPVADWETKRRWVKEAFDAFEKVGYHVIDAYTVVKNPESTHFVYREKLWTGADMIGLGVSSFGHINGVHIQNEKDYGPYLKKVEEGLLPINRALKITDEEKMIREFILQMKTGFVDLARFDEKFDVKITERYSESIDKLKDLEFIKRDSENIEFLRDGLLQVDNVLQDFFLAEHQNARYT